ncbi:hypothetical protein GTQ34_16530 [Muricauda sp. JGD-17]|uniref:Type II secretion system protein GspC N-terminal domain-containing protein n=1 Tax=Flagellimonas ochracea TaxID=2696472 RepID=A0A964TEQ9_9FLAO|nr:hypothetical protein [Allomuricauda ochracea]NAY93515.1 hypothetical protein [Allomuricauda ochracea]
MSKNVKTYVLLGVVLLIWGIIGFKLLGAFSPETEPSSKVRVSEYKPAKTVERDTFSLIADYRDPFLGTLPQVKSKDQSLKKKKKPIVQFPRIFFTGLVSGGQAKENIFFVTIDNRQYLMRKGDIKEGITLVKGSPNSIRVHYQGLHRTIPLQNGRQ